MKEKPIIIETANDNRGEESKPLLEKDKKKSA